MMRLKSDLADICNKACEGKLENQTLDWDSRKAVGVVMAAKGYPYDYKKEKLEICLKNMMDLRYFMQEQNL